MAATALVFQRGAGDSSQTISYWAGSSKIEGGGGPVPAFTNPPQPAWVDIPIQGSHRIGYAAEQPIENQTIFMSIIVDNNKENPIGTVSFNLAQGGVVTFNSNTCPASSQVVVQDEGDYWAVMFPANIPT